MERRATGSQREELDELRALIQELRAELRALRRENSLLRQAMLQQMSVVAPGGQAAVISQHPQVPSTPERRTQQDVVDMEEDRDWDRERRGREPGTTPEAKRTPGVARTLVVDGPDGEHL